MQYENKNSTSEFERSVMRYSAADVKTVTKKGRKNIRSLLIQAVLIAICIAVFGYSLMTIALRMIETKVTEDVYSDLVAVGAESAVKRASSLPEPSSMYTLKQMMDANGVYSDYTEEFQSEDDLSRRHQIYRSFLSTASNYANVYGWIYVDNTKINYPIMKDTDNTFYLTHDYRGNVASSGSIFASCELSNNYDANLNNVIYGHCMKNGTMFRTLKTFLEQANRNTLAKTMRIEIYTKKGLYVYKILSAYRDVNFSFKTTYFSSSDEYLAFLKQIVSNNTLRVNQDYDENSRICTLVTCANVTSREDERYVMHGILTSFIPASNL